MQIENLKKWQKSWSAEVMASAPETALPLTHIEPTSQDVLSMVRDSLAELESLTHELRFMVKEVQEITHTRKRLRS